MLGMDMCQCPLGLVPHFYKELVELIELHEVGVNALTG